MKGTLVAKRIPKLQLTQIGRFWQKVDSSGGPDACWPWAGHIGENGYGIVSLKGKAYKAHRVSYFIARGLRQYEIARQFGVSEATVSYLKNGGRWDFITIR
jgi:hypothetical protein